MLLFLVLFHIPISNRSCGDFYKGQRKFRLFKSLAALCPSGFPTAVLVAWWEWRWGRGTYTQGQAQQVRRRASGCLCYLLLLSGEGELLSL